MPLECKIDHESHLTIRMVNRVGQASMTTSERACLPPTAVNLVLLRAPIPAGYPRCRAPGRSPMP